MDEAEINAELKLNLGIFSIKISRPLRKRTMKIDPLDLVAQRFLKIFHDHDVATSQIPRLIPQISLEKLRNTETLLPALTPELMQQTADLFGIKRTWLEGLGSEMYKRHFCYKDPWAFFEELSTLKIADLDFLFPIMGFSSVDTLDYRRAREQNITLVLTEKITNLDGKEIRRYKVFGDELPWDYWKSRIELKAIMRTVDRLLDRPVPLYKVSKDILNEITLGYRVPNPYMNDSKRLYGISLEDYALSPEESRQSKEFEELPVVLDYIETYNLDKIILNPNQERILPSRNFHRFI